MTDRELLELAAKAAGLCIEWVSIKLDDDFDARLRNENPLWFNWPIWNPLTDDGDALRLAVKLGLNIDVYRQEPLRETPIVEVRGYVHRLSLAIEQAVDNGASLESAARRAIVRAAAEMGALK